MKRREFRPRQLWSTILTWFHFLTPEVLNSRWRLGRVGWARFSRGNVEADAQDL